MAKPRERRYAIAAALLGWLLGIAFAMLTVVRGFIWLAPMAVSLALGNAPLAATLVRKRQGLRRALADALPRRYRLPTGPAERQCPTVVSDAEGRTARSVRLEPARALERLSEWTALGDTGEPRRVLMRLGYAGLPARPCVPAVFIDRADRTLGVAWSGPERVVVATFARLPEEPTGEDQWAAAVQAATVADARRAPDLAAAGGLDIAPAEPAARALVAVGYEAVGVVPLAALSDFLTLVELEFAWPRGSTFTVETFDDKTTPVACLHARGTHPDGTECDVVLMRVADDMFHTYVRRTEIEPASG